MRKAKGERKRKRNKEQGKRTKANVGFRVSGFQGFRVDLDDFAFSAAKDLCDGESANSAVKKN